MKKGVFIPLILAFFTITLYSQSFKATIYFNKNSSRLDPPSRTQLNNLAKNVQDKKNTPIVITGYADNEGGNTYNLVLSKKRALAVLEYFTKNGIEKNKIRLEFYGEDKPLTQNDNEKGRQQNRRVELAIGIEPVASTQLSKITKIAQVFRIQAGKIAQYITIYGREGTVIIIPKEALCLRNGDPVKGDVEIHLKEFYKKSEMVLPGLCTLSDGQLLETSGMLFIEAFSSDRQLQLKEGTEILVSFAAKPKERMQLFTGEEQAHEIIWKEGPVLKSFAEKKTSSFYQGNANTDNIITSVMTLTNTLLMTGDLGWISCSRFVTNNYKTNLVVNHDSASTPTLRLVFKNTNSILPGQINTDGTCVFSNVPVGQKATLIAFGFVKEQFYFASKEVMISNEQQEKLTLRKTSPGVAKVALKKLD